MADRCKAFCDKTLRLGSLFAPWGILCYLTWYWVWAWEIKVRLRNNIKISPGFFTLSAKWAVKGANPRTLRELRRTCSRISTMPEYYLSSLNANKSYSLSKQPHLFKSFQSTCSLRDLLERKIPFSHSKMGKSQEGTWVMSLKSSDLLLIPHAQCGFLTGSQWGKLLWWWKPNLDSLTGILSTAELCLNSYLAAL